MNAGIVRGYSTTFTCSFGSTNSSWLGGLSIRGIHFTDVTDLIHWRKKANHSRIVRVPDSALPCWMHYYGGFLVLKRPGPLEAPVATSYTLRPIAFVRTYRMMRSFADISFTPLTAVLFLSGARYVFFGSIR